LNSAVEKRRISDVPIGCFLSGGIDSGLITALLATQSPEKINTFTIGLSYEEMNEMPDARIVADRYNTNHHEIVLEADVLNTVPDLIEFCGEPFADSSLIPSHYVSKAIGSHVKVALSGDGGDELFGGYNDYGLAYRSFAFAKKYPNSHWRNIQVLIDKIAGRLRGKKENAGAYSDYLTRSGSRKLFREMGFLETSPLYNPEFKESKSGFAKKLLQEKWDLFSDNNLPDNLMASSLHTRLLNDYLVKVDRASMYNSLEVRSPFLDTDLLEFAFSLPPEHKFHGNVNKYILKQIAKKYIDVNIEKRAKRGFGIPVHEWLRKDMKNWAQSIIFDGLLKRNEWFNPGFVEKIWKSHQEGSSNNVHQLWSLICFELWMQKFN
jgi:asparagine synthase (glutamine-hydrolysing)